MINQRNKINYEYKRYISRDIGKIYINVVLFSFCKIKQQKEESKEALKVPVFLRLLFI